jgi:methionine aminopeptidase
VRIDGNCGWCWSASRFPVCSPLPLTLTQTLQGILTQLVPGKKVVEICEFGDTVIERQCALSYKSKKIEKGVAFPTCVSVNEVVCHYSPLAAESVELKAGDSVKMWVPWNPLLVMDGGVMVFVSRVACSDLGCHIDGFIAVVGHTAVVGAAPSEPVAITGRQADVIMATYQAAEAAVRTIKPGNTVG